MSQSCAISCSQTQCSAWKNKGLCIRGVCFFLLHYFQPVAKDTSNQGLRRQDKCRMSADVLGSLPLLVVVNAFL